MGNIEGTSADRDTVVRALELYKDEVSVTQIAKDLDKSRATIYNWMEKGLLTDGTHWKDYREYIRQFKTSRRKAQEAKVIEDWADKMSMDLETVAEDTVKAMKDAPKADADRLSKVIKLKERLENRGVELKQLQESFMRKVMLAIREEVGEHKFNLIVEKMKDIQADQIKQIDPEYAEAIISGLITE